jgi:cell division protein FtsI/penicillin-binding protein 2
VRALWTAPERGPILSAAGEPLFELRPVITVYVQPRRARDLDAVLAVLDETLQIEPAPLRERLEAADPDHLVDVVTLRVDDYAPLRTTLQPVPGLVFRKDWRPLTPTRAFARALLGRVGPPTAEVLATAGPGFGPADLLGLSGLQRRFQRRLAGRPGLRIVTVDANGDEVATLHETAPVPGEALRTTLDRRIQVAADEALSTVDQASALVVVRPSSGEVLAVANGPDGGAADLALSGRYALGSAFDVITTAALAEAGLASDAPASRLPHEALVRAGGLLGFGGDWTPGVDAFTGDIPDGVSPATGQGNVQASPLLMASVAAAATDGTSRPPVLLPDHAQPGDGPRDLEPDTIAALVDLMRDPAGGRGGRSVHASISTVENDGSQLPTHAWALAYRGDLALAVLIEGEGRAGAASVAERFLRRL